ncbi:hypothetical protein T07_240, partial [Trichinella nelsoni]
LMLQIYGEKCSSASTIFETASQFPLYKKAKAVMYSSRAKRFPPLPATSQQLFTIHVFKESKLIPLVYSSTDRKYVVAYCEIFHNLIAKAAALGVVLQPQTIICDFETAHIPAVHGSFPRVHIQGCYFYFCRAILSFSAPLLCILLFFVQFIFVCIILYCIALYYSCYH